MRWEVSYNTNERPNQRKTVEANSSEEAKRKVRAIAESECRNPRQFHFSVNGVRSV
jgi:hypothetical protein